MPDDLVTIALPNRVAFVATTIACWKLGAIPQPVSARLPARELDAIIELAAPRVVVDEPLAVDGFDAGPLPDAVSNPYKAMTSGGSTGRPKLILANQASLIDPDAAPLLGMTLNGTHLMPGPLYHNGPFIWTMTALLAGNHVVLGGKFDAEGTLQLIDRYHPDSMYVVPTMMARISKLPPDVRDRYDVSSLKVVWHLAAPCPPWLKEEWINWLGAGDDLGAVRRHRGAGRDDHHRRRVAGAPRLGREGERQPVQDRRAPTAPTPIPAKSARCSCGRPTTRTSARTATSAPRRGASTAVGSRSATWACSTPTATST